MSDLFDAAAPEVTNYSAQSIEVLEGLEPVRHRPGMYIGGTDETALHHLVAEILDNSMDEAVAGFANKIDVIMNADYSVTITDNGRGIPVDAHPKYPNKSALEVIMTMLHSGGKFGGGAYKVSGGLHGVGLSVVNALSEKLVVEIARDKKLYRQEYAKGIPQTPLELIGNAPNRRGTSVTFKPDPEIFGATANLQPNRIFRMARSKAFLFKGIKINWSCAPELLGEDNTLPAQAELCFPNGILDFLNYQIGAKATINRRPFSGEADLDNDEGKVEWAITWPEDENGFCHSYCNTVITPFGGTHETGFKSALLKGLKEYGEMVNNKKAAGITAEDFLSDAAIMLSVFIRDPQFQGQTKDKLTSAKATRLVESAVKDSFDHWLSSDLENAAALLDYVVDRADARKKKKEEKEKVRKAPTKRLRLPGKLADCSKASAEDTEIFIVEGDSAGGSAKQGRDRTTQAILPLRGKILNVASASLEKITQNQEIKDMIEALGCGTKENYKEENLRYEKIIIMTDADVDGAHIASLLMTFFYQHMPLLIANGHLFIATPPLYKIAVGGKNYYALDDDDKDKILAKVVKGNQKPDISRFKGLGEMSAQQLKETTMDKKNRMLLRVMIPSTTTEEGKEEAFETRRQVERLMGKNPELRFKFIIERAKFVDDLDI
ncbi:MAG: DNA topoisomerase IV subunit B [bacterium]|nr:DNA topoisomerase IV subunit B [bacterium]MDY2830402.1 DNA topoisomerase IV subunit B [Alphaproteobacteria bacterium]